MPMIYYFIVCQELPPFVTIKDIFLTYTKLVSFVGRGFTNQVTRN